MSPDGSFPRASRPAPQEGKDPTGPGVSRAVAIPVPSQITARAKTSGKNGTLVFARFSAFRTTAPNPDPAAYPTPPAI